MSHLICRQALCKIFIANVKQHFYFLYPLRMSRDLFNKCYYDHGNCNGVVPYIFEDERVRSFKKTFKVKGAPLCVPGNFAKAGFYSVGTRNIPDAVKCFACFRVLTSWEPGDDPWEEHVRRGANCPYVQYISKGGSTFGDFCNLLKGLVSTVHETKINEILEDLKE